MANDLPPMELELCQLEILDELPWLLTRLRRPRQPDGRWWLVVVLDEKPEFAAIAWDAAHSLYRVGALDDRDQLGRVPEMLINDRDLVIAWIVRELAKLSQPPRPRLSWADLLVLPRDE